MDFLRATGRFDDWQPSGTSSLEVTIRQLHSDVRTMLVHDTFTSEDAYRGPACAYAGVEPGQVYEDRKEAEVDASWLFRSSNSSYKVVEV